MVYTTLEVILGIVVSREDLVRILNLEIDPDQDPLDDDRTLGTTLAGRPVRIYGFPCCSPANGKQYLIGLSLHLYYRKHGVHCDQCHPNRLWVCNTCLGTTNNGVYDVVAIHKGPVEANLRHICLHCFADNRKDLMAPQEDLPVVDNRVQGDPNNPALLRCETCGIKPDWRFCPQTVLKKWVHHYEQLKNVLKVHDVPLDRAIKFYYMVNDCMSCT
jgi:hypothetical protein